MAHYLNLKNYQYVFITKKPSNLLEKLHNLFVYTFFLLKFFFFFEKIKLVDLIKLNSRIGYHLGTGKKIDVKVVQGKAIITEQKGKKRAS